MLKSAIIVTAIASILSTAIIANSADKSNHLITKSNSLHPSTSNLIVKGKKARIEGQDPLISRELPDITKVISQYYKKQNEDFAPSGGAWSGACSFWLVKSLKLVALSDTIAEVQAEIDSQTYSLLGMHMKPPQWAYQKREGSLGVQQQKRTIKLEKIEGKWKVANN